MRHFIAGKLIGKPSDKRAGKCHFRIGFDGDRSRSSRAVDGDSLSLQTAAGRGIAVEFCFQVFKIQREVQDCCVEARSAADRLGVSISYESAERSAPAVLNIKFRSAVRRVLRVARKLLNCFSLSGIIIIFSLCCR